jgi:hypothetical protein
MPCHSECAAAAEHCEPLGLGIGIGVQDAAERPNVAFVVVVPAVQQLGWHVQQRAHPA